MSVLIKTKKWSWKISDCGINESISVNGESKNICKENQHFAYISLPGKDCVPKMRDVINNDKSIFAGEKSIVFPEKIEKNGNFLRILFKNPDVFFTLEALEKEESVIFRLTDVTPKGFNYGRFFFACFELNEHSGDVYSSAITHNIEIQAVELPGYCRRCGAYTTQIIGDIGKACEILICEKENMRQNIKNICGKLSLEDVIVTKKGGAFSDECEAMTLNYAEIDGRNLYDLDKFLQPHRHIGVNLFDIGHGYVFRQGDMQFLLGDIKKFRTDFADKLHKMGLRLGLHIYGAMIAEDSPYVTPIPHKDLAAIDYYTLREDLSADGDALYIEENTDNIRMIQKACERKPCCFCIDDEIIVFEKRGEDGSEGKVYNLERGAFGTKAAFHKKGSRIRHLARDFTHFNPLPGSELYYEIARKAAELYNDGDFDFMYIDGLDVAHTMYDPERLRWLPDTEYELKWYYSARFVWEILKHCKKEPMVEYSMTCPAYWAARSREGTFDTFFTGYKAAIDYHCRMNEEYSHKKLLTSQLGWYDFYPMAFEYGTPYFSAYVTSYEFPEDVDYLGQKVVAYDSSVSSLSYDALKYPQMNKKRYENECVFAAYSKLKEKKYFSREVKNLLKSEEKRYRLAEKDGKYGFYETERHFGLPYSFSENENSFNVLNKFGEQKPFIRLLCNHFADEDENSVTLAKFDNEIPLNEQKSYVDLMPAKDEYRDLTGNEALGVWVKGNNTDEYMSIGILENMASKILMQSLIHLNFEGWRYFALCEKDSNEALDMKFNYTGDAKKAFDSLGYHSLYQPTPNYDKAYALIIGFTGEGKNVYMGDVKAIKPQKEAVKNPSVEINGDKITFACELMPSEYIEYSGGDKADILDVTGKVREAKANGTSPTLKNGENSVYIRGEGSGVRRIKAYLITEDKNNFLTNEPVKK